jgi:hypothetical protein
VAWEKARIVKGIRRAMARQRHDKHFFMATNKYATVEEFLEMVSVLPC